jgi:hypothetical protein
MIFKRKGKKRQKLIGGGLVVGVAVAVRSAQQCVAPESAEQADPTLVATPIT